MGAPASTHGRRAAQRAVGFPFSGAVPRGGGLVAAAAHVAVRATGGATRGTALPAVAAFRRFALAALPLAALAARFRRVALALALTALAAPMAAAAATDVPPPVDPRELGRPAETLAPGASRALGRALEEKGLVTDADAPLALRYGLVAAQERANLAPTGWLDDDTARALGLDSKRLLPIEAGAGSMRTAGATAGGGPVGGPPGPASPVPSAAELGAPVTAPGDAAFHLAEARRLAAAAESLRLRADDAADPKPLRAQARKADRVAALHEERFREAGGEASLATEVPGG